jgi:ABC-type branched-subunit amino acid transport system substrate-binding protein
MSSRKFSLIRNIRYFVLTAALALPAALSACQSSNLTDALDPATVEAGKPSAGPPRRAETLGKGSTEIAMLLPLSASGKLGEEGRRMRDASQLAMTDLGDELVTLTIEDTGGDSGRARELAMKALGSGAKVLIGPIDLAAARHLASISGRRPPVLALAENFSGGAGVYAVRLGEADSAAAGAAAIAAEGARKFVLFVAKGDNNDAVEKQVANSLSIHGATLAVTMAYFANSAGIEKAVSDMAALVGAPEAIIIANGDSDPAPLISSLKAKGLLRRGVSLVGTHRWLEHPLDRPELEGAYLAALDPSETGPIASRFESTFSYEPDVSVAYAYDMVALTAGIASALGPNGFKKEVLENPGGFRGSTGFFRFRSDGSSQRSMPFYRIQKSGLKKVKDSTSGF